MKTFIALAATALLALAATFVSPKPAACGGHCGPDKCYHGAHCHGDCVCIMPNGYEGYCAKIN